MPGLPWGSLGWNCCSVPPAGGAGGKEGGPWWAEVTGGWQMMARKVPERSWRQPVTRGVAGGWHYGHACMK